ncbi:MAG: DUF6335 family protein [Rudaea sp.]
MATRKPKRPADQDTGATQDRDPYIKNRRDADDPDVVDEEVKEIFAEEQNLDSGARELQDEMEQHNSESPVLSGGDVDADWQRADDVGEEAVGGSVSTPDQDVVDELGQAAGLTYSDTEPLHTADKLDKRDRRRWELDPASSPDYQDRVREEFEEARNEKDEEEDSSE